MQTSPPPSPQDSVTEVEKSGEVGQHSGHQPAVPTPVRLEPAVQELKDFIDGNTRLRELFHQTWTYEAKANFDGGIAIQGYEHMFELLNDAFRNPPIGMANDSSEELAGLPFLKVFYSAAATPSGYAAFKDTGLTAQLKKLFDRWNAFLCSGTSRKGLVSWVDPDQGCLQKLVDIANAPRSTHLAFEDLYVCDAGQNLYGFPSWDAFFVRPFRDGVRPVDTSPDTVVHPCESSPHALTKNIQLQDDFLIKEKSYSLLDILQDKDLAGAFVGGTVYHAFLNQYSYHRWHAPVSGVVRSAYTVDGQYYANPQWVKRAQEAKGDDKIDITHGQTVLAATSSRAIIVIDAENPAIGRVAFVGVGMFECSTVELTVSAGMHIEKGDEMGMFHFGGSCYCMMFQATANLTGFPEPRPGYAGNSAVNSTLARVAD